MTASARSALAVLVLAAGGAGCSSSQPGRSVSEAGTTASTASTTTITTTTTTTTRTEQLQVTVPDCGAGAYRPTTLLIVCATRGAIATDIRWTSWDAAGASGEGTVQLQGGAETGNAGLLLGDVSEDGDTGPHFTRLTVKWIGRSPDGHPSDSFQLGNGS